MDKHQTGRAELQSSIITVVCEKPTYTTDNLSQIETQNSQICQIGQYCQCCAICENLDYHVHILLYVLKFDIQVDIFLVLKSIELESFAIQKDLSHLQSIFVILNPEGRTQSSPN